MFYDVLVEHISAHLFRRREQCHCLPWNEPQQSAFSLAHRTIARHDFWNFALNLEGNLAAMAISLVFNLTLFRSAGFMFCLFACDFFALKPTTAHASRLVR